MAKNFDVNVQETDFSQVTMLHYLLANLSHNNTNQVDLELLKRLTKIDTITGRVRDYMSFANTDGKTDIETNSLLDGGLVLLALLDQRRFTVLQFLLSQKFSNFWRF